MLHANKGGAGIAGLVIVGLAVAAVALTQFERHKVEQPDYTVLKEGDGYEMRRYAPYIVARVAVQGEADGAANRGFRPLADYIFGNNTARGENTEGSEKVAMTTPVIQQPAESKKIAMTTPVIQEPRENTEADTHWVSFIMPSGYEMDELPEPNNDDVRLERVPAQTLAVIRFTWLGGMDRMYKKEDKLRHALAADGIEVTGKPIYAQYDPPWTLPFLRRNEVMLPVAYGGDKDAA